MFSLTDRPRPALERLRAALTDEQEEIYQEVEEEQNLHWTEDEAELVNEITRHLPGLAPAIRLIGAHVVETNSSERGACCEGRDLSPA